MKNNTTFNNSHDLDAAIEKLKAAYPAVHGPLNSGYAMIHLTTRTNRTDPPQTPSTK